MLSYFKYFAITLTALIFFGSVFIGIYFRAVVSNSVILAPLEKDAKHVADYFNESSWCKYSQVFGRLDNTDVSSWRKNRYYNNFRRITDLILGSVPAARVAIYNDNLLEFYNITDPNITFLDDSSLGREVLRLSKDQNKAVSKLLSSEKVYFEQKKLRDMAFVQVVVPVDNADCKELGAETEGGSNVSAYIEIIYDINNAWDRLYFFQIIVIVTIILLFGLLYGTLILVSRKNERILNKQHEEKVELEKAKTVAEMQNQQKSMFLANVSHELRTPLNAIIGFSEIIKDEVMGPIGNEQYKEYMNDINSSGVHLLSLINDILDYSKAEAMKLEVDCIDVDLTKIAESCMRLVEPRARDAKVRLVEKLGEEHLIVMGDQKRMKQVILNLLSNSVKFTPEGGQVSLELQSRLLEGKVSVIVADTGIGISQKDISKALSPFGQIDSSLSRRYEGTGLGLPLTKKLTEIMGGTFEIKSEVGLGTTIILTFPVKADKTKKEIDKF